MLLFEQVIEKHNKDTQNKKLNNQEESRKQKPNNQQENTSNHLASKFDITQFLSFYANQMEQENQQSPKKRKKKKQDQNKGRHL